MADLEGLSREAALPLDGGSEGGGDAGGGTLDGGGDGGAPAAYRAAVLADRPLAYWPMEDAVGSQGIVDVVSNTVAISSGAVALAVTGAVGKGVSMNGNCRFDFGDKLDLLGATPFTIEVWLKPTVGSDVFYEYVNKRAGGNNGYVVYVRYENGDTDVQLEMGYPGGLRGQSMGFPSGGRFVHVVFTFDPGTGMVGYVDGVRTAGGYTSGTGPTDSTKSFVIGGGYQGVFDELAIYDHALSRERVVAHLAAASAPPP